MLADVGEYSHFMEGRILAPPIVLIVVGAIVFIVAFLGCFGAIRESYYLLMAVSTMLHKFGRIKLYKCLFLVRCVPFNHLYSRTGCWNRGGCV